MPLATRSTFGTNLASSSYTENGYVLSSIAGWTGSSKPPPLIFCHASGMDTVSALADVNEALLLTQLAQNYTVYVGDFAGEAWGNDTATSRVEDARLYLANTWGSTGPLTLVGASMGTTTCLNYARLYPSNARAVACVLPALDLQDMRANRGFASQINAAYPAGDTAITAHSPVAFAANLPTTLPVLLQGSTDDPLCVPATLDAFVTARPTTKRVNLGAYQHNFTAVAAATARLDQFVRLLV